MIEELVYPSPVELDEQAVGVSFSRGWEILLSSKAFRLIMRPTESCIQWVVLCGLMCLGE